MSDPSRITDSHPRVYPSLRSPRLSESDRDPLVDPARPDDDDTAYDSPDDDLEASAQDELLAKRRRPSRRRSSRWSCPWLRSLFSPAPKRSPWRWAWIRALQLSALTVLGCVCAILVTAVFDPGYVLSEMPESWRALDDAVVAGGGVNDLSVWRSEGEGGHKTSGRGNRKNEKIYIAANIVDAELIAGEWGDRVMELVDLLGEENVFLSIFENDSGPDTTAALEELDARFARLLPKAGRSIISTTLPLEGVPHLRLPNGDTHVKRIEYLAEVRNRALLPLLGWIPSLSLWNQTVETTPLNTTYPLAPTEFLPEIPFNASAPALPTQWVSSPDSISRILFLNDVLFSPAELLHLLFSTNGGSYSAACGMDFINPLKYYDTFATRDAHGYNLGVPFFPFFASDPNRQAMLDRDSAIQVKSCWGGAVSFNATPFVSEGIRFRAEKEEFWEASECCLIHADLDRPTETFINPFVRSAYDARTFNWLPTMRRVEPVLEVAHRVVSAVMQMPWGGKRREEQEGDVVREVVWEGAWMRKERVARKGGFCGSEKLLVIEEREGGGRRWHGVGREGAGWPGGERESVAV